MPLVKLLTSVLFWVRVTALLFTCISFSVASHGDRVIFGPLVDRFICCWAFSFACTLLVLLVELFGLQTRASVIWSNFTITIAMYSFLFCFSAPSVFMYLYVYLMENTGQKWFHNPHIIVANVSSCLASIAYIVEWRRCKIMQEGKSYLATNPGELKVCQTFIACLIFIILSCVLHGLHCELRWCAAVYSICFVVSMAVVVLCVCERTESLPVPFPKFLFVYDVLAVIMYLSAIIICGLQFNGQNENDPASMILGDVDIYRVFLITMSVFTGCNFLCYLTDLVYCAELLFVST